VKIIIWTLWIDEKCMVRIFGFWIDGSWNWSVICSRGMDVREYVIRLKFRQSSGFLYISSIT